MPGYYLLERGTIAATPDGVEAHRQELGFLDFLRELAGDPFPFPRLAEIRVAGLEEVLFAARPDEAGMALEILRRLRQAASDLEMRVLTVQVIFRGKLVRGETLWSEFGGAKLPIGHIFGAPPGLTDGRGNRFYAASFNLTHA